MQLRQLLGRARAVLLGTLTGAVRARAASELPDVDVAGTHEVAPGDVVAFESRGRRFLLCNDAGHFYAVADRCTHAAWELVGSQLQAGELVCSLHGGRFDLRTGVATARPATKPLQTFPVRVRRGRIRVRVSPPPR